MGLVVGHWSLVVDEIIFSKLALKFQNFKFWAINMLKLRKFPRLSLWIWLACQTDFGSNRLGT